MWTYASLPPHTFMAWHSNTHKGNFLKCILYLNNSNCISGITLSCSIHCQGEWSQSDGKCSWPVSGNCTPTIQSIVHIHQFINIIFHTYFIHILNIKNDNGQKKDIYLLRTNRYSIFLIIHFVVYPPFHATLLSVYCLSVHAHHTA
jgi:hypothetical protein